MSLEHPIRSPLLLDPRVAGLAPSPTLAARERSTALAVSGRQVFRLGLGQSPFPVPQPVVEALRAHAAEKEYLPVRGLPELRRAVADYHCRRYGIARGEDAVVVGPGSKELMFLLQFCFGGELLVPVPAWVSYAPQARLAGRAVHFLPTDPSDDYKLRPDALAAACRDRPRTARMLVLNYPSNPTSCTYSATELAELAEVCRRYDLIALSDEIYGELHFGGEHCSLAAHYEDGTIVSGGLSKWCGAGGWRLGTFSFPARLRALADAMVAMGSETYSTTSAPIQCAAIRAFRGSAEIEDYLRAVRRILAALLGWAAARLRRAGFEVPEPQGGFYLYPSFARQRFKLMARGIRNDGDLAERLLKDAGISALPGRHFGNDDASLHVRLALVDFDGGRALTAAHGRQVDEGFLRRYCAPSYEAIHALVTFIEQL